MVFLGSISYLMEPVLVLTQDFKVSIPVIQAMPEVHFSLCTRRICNLHLFSIPLHSSFDFWLHLFRLQMACPLFPTSKPPTWCILSPSFIPLVSFTLHLQVHLLRHFQKSLPPRELRPPEDEPMEESKGAQCFCINPLRTRWVTGREKSNIGISVKCVEGLSLVFWKPWGDLKGKGKGLRYFCTAGLKGLNIHSTEMKVWFASASWCECMTGDECACTV